MWRTWTDSASSPKTSIATDALCPIGRTTLRTRWRFLVASLHCVHSRHRAIRGWDSWLPQPSVRSPPRCSERSRHRHHYSEEGPWSGHLMFQVAGDGITWPC
mmetsp:Transcript_58918/g.154511  ORF Transcript_58918/g.154511 Transcript_58918/m.154511 type:complete len:102 (-) Transcript_58918:39-344(-)